MSTTNRVADVTIAQLARMLTEQLLQVRRAFLKHRAPRSRYVHQLRRDVAGECPKARPVDMLLTLSIADLEDGAPLSLVLQPYHAVIAELSEVASRIGAAKSSVDLPAGAVLSLMQRETRFEHVMNAAQNEVLAHPDDVAAIDRLVEASAAYDGAQDDLVTKLRARSARIKQSGRCLAS